MGVGIWYVQLSLFATECWRDVPAGGFVEDMGTWCRLSVIAGVVAHAAATVQARAPSGPAMELEIKAIR